MNSFLFSAVGALFSGVATLADKYGREIGVVNSGKKVYYYVKGDPTKVTEEQLKEVNAINTGVVNTSKDIDLEVATKDQLEAAQ